MLKRWALPASLAPGARWATHRSPERALCGALRGAACLRTLDVAENPALAQVADLRLHVLHRLPTLTLLDGATVSALEKVYPYP